jgi:transposase-like protein
MGGRRRRREIAAWGHSRISPSDARAPARAQPVPVHADGGPAVIRAIFDARDRPEAERPGQLGKEYQEKTPRLAEWQEANGPESLKISSLPVGHRWQLRTSSLMERLNEEIERRTRAQDLFPNEASALRLVVARSPASPHHAAEQRLASRSYQPYPALTT